MNVVKIAVAITLVAFVTILAGSSIRACGETADVAHEQFGPRALLKKYEWFKEASASLDAKRANLDAAHHRQQSLIDSYDKAARSKWSREDREQYNLWESEETGMAASYNQLAAEYNAKMAEINWKFANAGDLPQGADRVLPREYREYVTK